ncbi:hypothetical protein C5S30_06385 [ANME-1 cluster archaeon GoMg4]|nr:hypothetical protein [ANME-1 cluster archaeon GoMg4]
MKPFKEFIKELNYKIGIPLPESWAALNEVQIAQRFLEKLNEYFFQTYEGIGTTTFNNEELQYFSEFHEFWEIHHKEILNVKIDEVQVELAAQALSQATRKYGVKIFKVTRNTFGLPPQAIAKVRFFTANQDFREPPENQFEKYFEDNNKFDAEEINEDPESFLMFLGVTRLSQTDKRRDFAYNAAQFLLEKDISAYDIATYFDNDAIQIREALVKAPNMGYGYKKANMFIRDMFELGVWQTLENFDKIDVASDINTMKLALRTRILQTEIPLLSSFLDEFCYQYGYLDEMSASAWRTVWEKWKHSDPKTAPPSPCKMDFLLYRIGREYCKDMTVQYTCENGHIFYHFGTQLKICPICRREGTRTTVRVIKKELPCQVNSDNLPRVHGNLLLKDDNLLTCFDGVCIFEKVCKPKNEKFCAFNPPKSISIKGKTSWTNSYAYRERGGGGMMG